MKVISLLQPHASLVAVGAKKIETRSWATKYRGPLGIHASRGFNKELEKLCIEEPFCSALTRAGYRITRSIFSYDVVCAELPLGAIIATCNLVDCIKMTPEFLRTVKFPELEFGHYSVGRYAWILEDVKKLDVPIPVKGQLGLWNYEGEIE